MKRLSGKQMFIIKLKCSLIKDWKKRTEYLKKKGIFAHLGDDCCYGTRQIPEEPYLVKIHNNVVIAADAKFITHDIINDMLARKLGAQPGEMFSEYTMGTIEIFDNVAIGSNVIIMPDVKIGPNAIVGTGSIVTKDVPEGAIVGGNPAKIIGSIDNLIEKRKLLKDAPINRTDIDDIMNYYWKNSCN